MELDLLVRRQQKENSKEWVAALRSGKYQQGMGFLQKDGKFCCLGVACDLYDPTAWVYDGDWCGDTRLHFGYRAVPENKVEHHFGMKGYLHQIIEMNDGGKTFPEIADFIEAHLT